MDFAADQLEVNDNVQILSDCDLEWPFTSVTLKECEMRLPVARGSFDLH